MLRSIESLQTSIKGPLSKSLGPKAKVLTVEAHGENIKGLALCPGKVVKYILNAQDNRITTKDLLTLKVNKVVK